MKFPETVNCVVFSFGYAESNQVPAFIFSTDFFGRKVFTPREALISLADDWYHFYLEELCHRKMMLVIKTREAKLSEAVNDVWKYCKECCRNSHVLDKEFCEVCKFCLRIDPSENDFIDFMTSSHYDCTSDGFWGECMAKHRPSWDPFWKDCGISHILKGNFLSIMESAENVFVSALRDSGKYPEVFNTDTSGKNDFQKILDDIKSQMASL